MYFSTMACICSGLTLAYVAGLSYAMSMNFFAFFPSLINEAINPNAKNTGFFANPAGPTGDQFAPLGGQGISNDTYSQKQAESLKFLEWFIKDETQKKWAELGGYTCSAGRFPSTRNCCSSLTSASIRT